MVRLESKISFCTAGKMKKMVRLPRHCKVACFLTPPTEFEITVINKDTFLSDIIL